MTEPIAAPPPQAVVRFSPPLPEDLNIETYSKIFDKCLVAAETLVEKRLKFSKETERQMTLDIARTIFDRFYSDQASMKQGKQQADAMLHGLTQVLEGRR